MRFGIVDTQEEMADNETILDNAITSRVVKILQALEEQVYVVEVKLPSNTTCTLVGALEFSQGQGDKMAFEVEPYLVPNGIVITRTRLANHKFSKASAEQLQEDQTRIFEQLEVIKSTGEFLTKAAGSFAKSEGKPSQSVEVIAGITDLLETRVPELVEKRSKLLQQQEGLKQQANRLDRDTLLIRVHHNGVGGTVQLSVRVGPLKSTVLSEYRYTTSPCSGSFQQLLACFSPIRHELQVSVDVFTSAKVPSFRIPTLPSALVRVSHGRIQLRKLKLGESTSQPSHVPICQLQGVKIEPGLNLLPMIMSVDPLRIRFEAFPEVEPGQVYAFGEVFNEWSHLLKATSVDVYRNNAFVHSHRLAVTEPGQKVFIPCGLEPTISVDLSTETERGGDNDKLDSHLAFLDISHNATVVAQDDPCAIRIKLQLPKLIQSSDDPKAKVVPLKNDYTVEDTEDFVDPDTDSATIHLVNDETTAILRMVAPGGGTSSTASFSYRIQWQDNVVTSRTGFGSTNRYEADVERHVRANEEPSGAAAPAPALFGTSPPTSQQQQQEKQPDEEEDEGRSWVEAGKLPASKKYSQQSQQGK